jgi:hypothetical protein
MLPVTASATIDCPRDRAFVFVADLANRPTFTDHFIRGYHLERIPSTGVGAAARFRVQPPTARMWMETVIDALEPPHMVRERGSGGRQDRIPVHTVWELLAGPASTTKVSVTFWTEPSHPIDRVKELLGARAWYRRRWSRALRRLKGTLESGETVARVRVAGEDRIPTLPSTVRH